jgi:hypothetical protein
MTVLRGSLFLQPAPLLNFIVRRTGGGLEMSQQPLILSHPLRVAAGLFVGLARPVVACAPFIDGIEPAAFLGPGLAYCLLLALFGVGLALAVPSRLVCWWLAASVIPLLGISAFGVLVWSSPAALLDLPTALMRGLQAITSGWVAGGCAVAGWGWVRYLRWRRSAARA